MKVFASFIESEFGPISFMWRETGRGDERRDAPPPGAGLSTGAQGFEQGALIRIFLDIEGARSVVADFGGRFVPDSEMPSNIVVFKEAVQKFLQNPKSVFPLSSLDFSGCGAFQSQVLQHEHAIPIGFVSTYSILAEACGSPRAVRAAGSSLARNPFPLLIPCHRAVRSDGSLGGYQGGLAMKRRLLEREGITFSPSGRVDLSSSKIWRFDLQN